MWFCGHRIQRLGADLEYFSGMLGRCMMVIDIDSRFKSDLLKCSTRLVTLSRAEHDFLMSYRNRFQSRVFQIVVSLNNRAKQLNSNLIKRSIAITTRLHHVSMTTASEGSTGQWGSQLNHSWWSSFSWIIKSHVCHEVRRLFGSVQIKKSPASPY